MSASSGLPLSIWTTTQVSSCPEESLWSAANERFALAAWMIIYAVLTDRLDGLVARAVKGTSELGAQLDSFADFLNFGVAPAYLVLTYLSGRQDLYFLEDLQVQ